MATSKSTTYSIYRIVCFPTGENYIGQTKHLKDRQDTHQYLLRLGKHHSKKLQAAYDQYGVGSFYSEVIESNVSDADADAREIYWIAHFDSYHNGFNVTPGGKDSGANYRKFKVGDREYDSIESASQMTGLSVGEIRWYLEKHGYEPGKMKPTKRAYKPKFSDYQPTTEQLTQMCIRLGILKT